MYYEDEEYLEHHGILGQKWGVRRFQRTDGTRTAAGKAREREDDSSSSGSSQNGGKKFHVNKKAVAVAAGVAVGAALLAHPATRQALTKYGKVAVSKLPGAMAKAGSAAGKAAAKTTSALEASGKRVGNAMLDAALLSVGAVEISKLERKMELPEDASQEQKDRNKVILDTAKAGITAATNPKGLSTSGGSNNGGKKGGTLGADKSASINAKVGAPSNKGVNKQSQEWNNLMNGKDEQTKNDIRAMAKAGYDLDQIDKYFNHADVSAWIHASEFGSYIV